ncbi:hypothetical protein AAHB50_29320 [Bacillus toyonensis]
MNAWINGINKDNVEQEKVNKLKQTIDAVKFKGLPQEQSFEDLLKYLFLVLNHVCDALSDKYLDGEKDVLCTSTNRFYRSFTNYKR